MHDSFTRNAAGLLACAGAPILTGCGGGSSMAVVSGGGAPSSYSVGGTVFRVERRNGPGPPAPADAGGPRNWAGCELDTRLGRPLQWLPRCPGGGPAGTMPGPGVN
jgi:hypothetical protein